MNDSIKINLKKKDYPKYQDLINQLVNLSYLRVLMVLEPGEFSVRGSIIDIFAINHSRPVRLEYFDEEIERLCSFNVHNQRSITNLFETEILSNQEKHQYRFTAISADTASEDVLSNIEEGSYVAHEDYGIGFFMGLKHMKFGTREGEYLILHYKGEDRLYVPLEQIAKIHLYSESEIVPRLNSLSDSVWKKTKANARKALEELAEDIYLMYKIRQDIKGISYDEDTVWQIDLEKSFPHEETPDQIKVTEEIKKDMESAYPMDRVLCGDVGYGKTEVVLRAAFKASENGKQTAILVPTTILADQHFRTFSQRFENYEHKVEVLSRFKSAEEQKEIIKDVADNKIKVIIGTHRLLQKDIQFADLGLLIIDEEQRFGVFHKEKIKQMRDNIDVITISATPIPRTLYMALTGARDFSILNTPPKKRKPVLTTVAEYDKEIVKRAISHEIKTQGQIFYLLNNIEQIKFKFTELQKMFPKLNIAIAHGQMKEHQLEDVIHDFIAKKYDILLCTTIIENGVDIPNANTIIIENAHLFGLSQIHQIRGRVGRTEKQGFAYLLYPLEELLSDKARKRLRAIKEYAALGSGYKLALKDLEIRGAGALLGKKQHGQMINVGFDLYCQILEESVRKVRNEAPVRKPTIIFDSNIIAAIPDWYISRQRERLAIYKRLMNLMYKNQMDEVILEIEDRYGQLPEELAPFFENIRGQLLEAEI